MEAFAVLGIRFHKVLHQTEVFYVMVVATYIRVILVLFYSPSKIAKIPTGISIPQLDRLVKFDQSR